MTSTVLPRGSAQAKKNRLSSWFSGRLRVHRWRLLSSVIVGIVLPVLATEAFETWYGVPEALEGALHSVVLMATLAPVFYFLWYRPLSREMAERQHAEAEVRRLSRQVMRVSEEERHRLGRDLHDEFGQKLVALQLQLDLHRQQLGDLHGDLADQCHRMLGTLRGLSDDLRHVVATLRPPLLDDLGLLSALEAQVNDLQRLRPELRVDIHSSGLTVRLPKELEIVLFRVCQEALNNVIKHAGADMVQIWLACCYPAVVLVVEDNGVGMAKPTAKAASSQAHHFGLLGMRERVAAVNGTFRLQSEPGKGTRLRVELPLPVRE
jgi:signal transduction histidine kinase